MKSFAKLFYLLNRKERNQAALLLFMIIIMSLLDMTGVASILPFMAVLTNPSLIETNMILKSMFEASKFFGIQTSNQFLFALGVLVLLLLIISLTFKAITIYVQARFVQMREYSIGKRLVEGYLNQPYNWFLTRNSADLGKTILSEVEQLISFGMRPLMDLIAKSMIAFALIILLIIVDIKLTLVIGFVLGSSYLLIFFFVRSYLDHSGKKRLNNNQLRFTAINEAFGAAKEVKIAGLENVYIKKFANSAKTMARAQASSIVIAQLPRFILESIAFGGILLIILLIMSQTGSFNNALPIISLYVFAGYRLMPALQQIYEASTQLIFVSPSLNKLYYDLKSLEPYKKSKRQEPLIFEKDITLNSIFFAYPNSHKQIFKSFSLSIPAKSIVGIVGATGSGKTTLVDIILGLHKIEVGTLKVDGELITNNNLRSWQSLIGYVPQQIYLNDDTIEANIAFGIDYKNLNRENVVRASKIANLHNFINNDLPNKYETIVGERGIKLSGGQRQRIGIARALYHNPKLLILDEATSALDNQTEKAVMDAVNNLGKDITTIIIAHRLSTVKKCDKIFLLEKGQLIDQGNFEELINKNEDFRNNAKL